ncbi:hypothetical protein FSP39_006174 [Pinctada imbricata]|uniref:RNA-directed DNA polymerase from mobile element jockey n=1 Tax=Pinctada imbricata TaxID=66713 RepID=A0AA89BV08_PINIB|nr:hypothetical protein FSP39_006174 [Pinctada imbricata]
MLPNMSELTYEDRLRKLKLPTLKFRRLRRDMIETFKITTGVYDPRVTKDLFELVPSNTTRGHHLKISKKRCNLDVRKYFFINRVVNVWNQLPESIINAKNVKTFESRLNRHWGNHPMIYNYEAEYNVKIHHQEPQQDFTPEETDVELNTVGLPWLPTPLLSERT